MRRTLTLSAALVAALAGCGGDGGKTGSSGGPPVTVAAGQPVPVTAKEYRFEPGSLVVKSTSKGPTVVTFSLRNGGAVAHDLHVMRGSQDLGGTPIFAPGQTETGRVTLTPGSYTFVCTVGDHEALGMKGTLVVR